MVSKNLHIQDEQAPKLTLCGRWSRKVTLLGDDYDHDMRTVCLGCTRRSLAIRIRDRMLIDRVKELESWRNDILIHRKISDLKTGDALHEAVGIANAGLKTVK